jgi:Putative Ig domain
MRYRVGLVCLALVGVGLGLGVGGGRAVGAVDPTVEVGCPAGTLSGSTYTLTADCDTTVQLTVPDGQTVNGAGHTITPHDPAGGNFTGSVLINAGTSMNIENVTVKGGVFATNCGTGLKGIFFNDASGAVSGVHVLDITQHNGCAGTGLGIRANGLTAARTVTITDTVVSGYQKSALVASGSMTMKVSSSTLGPPDSLVGVIAQNGVQFGGAGVNVGAGGSITASTIYGSGYGNSSNDGTAVLLYGAKNVTLADDIITGAGTDVGVAVATDTFDTPNVPSSGIAISHNQIGRTAPDSPDSFGIGVSVDPSTVSLDSGLRADPSSATLICNSFTGWKTDIVGAEQALCITTTALPGGTAAKPYSTTLAAVSGTQPYHWSLASGMLPPGLTLSPTGTISGTPTAGGTFAFTVKVTDSAHPAATATQALSITITGPSGYWLAAADGGVFTFGGVKFHGSTGGVHLNAPIVGITATPQGGYWLVANDGGVFSFGAPFFGSLGATRLNAPVVGIAATPDGGGYYLVGSDGGVFTFGDAHFKGSTGNIRLNKPVVGMAVTPDNQGYYLAAADGGVFAFGDAHFKGSTGGITLNKPVVGIAVDDATSGYWLVASDGGVCAFGAPFLGSTGNVQLVAPVVGMAPTADDLGYRFAASDGGVFCFGTAQFKGSMGGIPLNKPVVGIASTG